MEEKNPKIIALLSKIEKNTGKLISMVKGRGSAIGNGSPTGRRAITLVAPSVTMAVKPTKAVSNRTRTPGSIFAAPMSKKNVQPAQAMPVATPQIPQKTAIGRGETKSPAKIASKATRVLPERDKKGRFVKRKAPEVKSQHRKEKPVKQVQTSTKPVKSVAMSTVGKSQQALDMRRRKKEAQKERSDMAKVFGKALKTTSKLALSGAKAFIWSQQMKSGGNAMGLAAGGAFWAGMREVIEAVEMAKGNRIIQAMGQKFSDWKSSKKDDTAAQKGGPGRDEKGHFIKRKAVQATVPDAKGRLSAIADPAQSAKTATRNKRLERKGDRQHRELIKAIEEIPGSGGDGSGLDLGDIAHVLPRMGKLGRVGKLLGKAGRVVSKGPIKALAGAAGVAGSAAAVGGKLLGKVPILGKVLPGAAKMGGKVLGESGGKFAAKEGGKVVGKIGAKAVGKSVLKKIPALGLLAGAGFAISRLAKGDVLGAIAELGSGAVSLVPGIGTAASVAIDAGLAARDISRESNKDLKNSLNKDFESATIPETASAPVQNKPPAVETVQTIDQAPAQQSISVSTITAAFEAALKRVLGQQAKDKGQKQPYRIPTDFDEPLLVLMAHDRI